MENLGTCTKCLQFNLCKFGTRPQIYKKLFESKEFYNAIMKSLGNVIYRILNSDETFEKDEDKKE